MRALVVGGLLCAAACIPAPSEDSPQTTDAGPGDAATVAPADGGGADGATLPTPKPPCDPSTQTSASAVFVSTTGDDLLGGTRAAPVKTIAKALALAKAQSATDVYLQEGVYAEEVTIASATTVHGGWKASGASWTKDCADGVVGLTVIRSTTARAITVSGFTGRAGLDTLTVATKGQADPNQSSIAIFVSGTSLSMSGVDVASGIGGDGVTPATPPAAGDRSCGGGSCSNGNPGAASTAGTSAMPGHFDATGWVAAIGSQGKPGAQGENGTPGLDGQSTSPCVQSCGATPGCAAGPTGTSSASSGKCGCGGLGGAAGAPGTSGGASVAVQIVGPGSLSITHSNLSAARGGNGAPGGAGGPGGGGTNGANGAAGFCAGGCFFDSTQNSCWFTGTTLSGGGAGGKGGAGSAGGQGGGGAGGPSHGVVALSGATLEIDPSTLFQVAAGGTGAGGAPAGASGEKLTL